MRPIDALRAASAAISRSASGPAFVCGSSPSASAASQIASSRACHAARSAGRDVGWTSPASTSTSAAAAATPHRHDDERSSIARAQVGEVWPTATRTVSRAGAGGAGAVDGEENIRAGASEAGGVDGA